MSTAASEQRTGGSRLIWVPLAGFVLLFAIVAIGLWRPADRTVRSALVGKPMPGIALAPVVAGKPGIEAGRFAKGQARLVNIFASWCIPCAAEAPQLLRLKAMGVPIDAVAVKDTPAAVAAFLARYGDPYDAIGGDPDSAVQFALGSSGVPETFLVDGNGRIVEQHVGDIRAEEVDGLAAKVRGLR
ncbi:cytochrome c biogenesis protein CcmG, thiol:disulfide interchange protein DsbE [Sphingomonas gellani]|uniref:Cytochrome c biogenesis protein CcmG, thiol:disulfide interchange protein DsbE n=1 Tax=Sphingomonas gellani TaxID=1166340 RepID=A0A1H7YC67_9SPHN|nr:redoxin family protein [Sphingomonas gellani]SEM42759.1 cytochrome c biogenesis protein CcmG, thiol:disulfide interchange protein DsbE [Sphingomonas gellani]